MKTLIFLPFEKLAPVGGKLGVGYNLSKEFERRGITDIEFCRGESKSENKNKIIQLVRWGKSFFNYYICPSKKNECYFNKYDIIHFHSVSDYYKERKSLKNFKGITILTSHSPIPMAIEMYQDIQSKFSWIRSKYLFKKLVSIDEYAFSHADYIMFPCPEAEEPYYNNWGNYRFIHDDRADRYVYCTTGIEPVKAKNSRCEIREELGITDDTYVVCYVGRHNAVKGYDRLKNIGEKILSENSDTMFLICGKEWPLEGLEHDRWKEIGWTKNAHSYIQASDVFVLPNKETYFDLIMLEVMCLGKIVVASRTGGNKYYERENVEGIFLYDTEEEAVALINQIKEMSKEEKERLEKSNYEYFFNKLTVEKYVDSYIEMLERIVRNK